MKRLSALILITIALDAFPCFSSDEHENPSAALPCNLQGSGADAPKREPLNGVLAAALGQFVGLPAEELIRRDLQVPLLAVVLGQLAGLPAEELIRRAAVMFDVRIERPFPEDLDDIASRMSKTLSMATNKLPLLTKLLAADFALSRDLVLREKIIRESEKNASDDTMELVYKIFGSEITVKEAQYLEGVVVETLGAYREKSLPQKTMELCYEVIGAVSEVPKKLDANDEDLRQLFITFATTQVMDKAIHGQPSAPEKALSQVATLEKKLKKISENLLNVDLSAAECAVEDFVNGVLLVGKLAAAVLVNQARDKQPKEKFDVPQNEPSTAEKLTDYIGHVLQYANSVLEDLKILGNRFNTRESVKVELDNQKNDDAAVSAGDSGSLEINGGRRRNIICVGAGGTAIAASLAIIVAFVLFFAKRQNCRNNNLHSFEKN